MHGHEHWNFLADDQAIVIPAGWTRHGPGLGPIFCRTTHLRLIDGRGRKGLMAEDGKFNEVENAGRFSGCLAMQCRK